MSEEKLSLIDRFKLMDEAAQHKLMKYVKSGTMLIGLGLVVILIGLFLKSGISSAEVLLIGFGGLIILFGIIRVMIGFINPTSPNDIPPPPVKQPDLDSQIFEHNNNL